MTVSKSKKYIYLYLDILKDFNIKVIEGALILLIWSFSKQEGYCYAGKKHLAKILNTTETTIHSLIKKLVNKGLLRRVGYSQYKTSCYAPSEVVIIYLKKLKEIEP